MFYEHFKSLCNEKKTTPTAVIKALGLSTSKITAWKNGSEPKMNVLEKLADYFNVSLDYFAGRPEAIVGGADKKNNDDEASNFEGVEIMENDNENIIDGADENNRFGTWVKSKRESMAMSRQDFAKKIYQYWDARNIKWLEEGDLRTFLPIRESNQPRQFTLENVKRIVEIFNELNAGPVDYYQALLLIELDDYSTVGRSEYSSREIKKQFEVFDKDEMKIIWNNIVDVFAKRKESYEAYFIQVLGNEADSIIKNKGYISLSKIYEIARNANIDAYDILPVARAKEDIESAFIAMWFVPPEEKAEDKSIKKDRKRMEKAENALRQAIEARGFTPSIVNDNKHDNNLYNEIIARIKACKFMVADLTGNRQSVYFEIGFAHGLGKPVIQTCHKDHFDNVAFDLKQIYTIIWDDKVLKSTEKLKEDVTFNIAATIAGARPLDLPASKTLAGTVTTNQLAEMLIKLDKKMATKDDIAALDKRIIKLESTSKDHTDQIEYLDGEEQQSANS
jgi:transcriptional regulator with XRE-family HTH domain